MLVVLVVAVKVSPYNKHKRKEYSSILVNAGMELFFAQKITLPLPYMEKILLIQTSFIGDVILATALLEQLHDRYPDSRIDLLVRKGNESLFKDHPFLGELYVWDKKAGKYKDLWRILKLVRAQGYDLLLNLQRFGTTGLFTVLSGAKETRGFQKNPFALFFSKAYPHEIGNGTHEVERNQILVGDLCKAGAFKPKLYPAPIDEATYGIEQPFVCMAPNSVWFTKMLPKQRWVELLKCMPKGIDIVLLGAPNEAEFCQEIIDASGVEGNVYNLCGKLSLLQSAALMSRAKMNYVNDSAPLHLCSAVNAPQVAFFCSTSPSFGFTPMSDKSIILEAEPQPSCKPCGLHGKKLCPEGHFKCGEIGLHSAVEMAIN